MISTYKNPWNPYEIALHFCLESLLEHQIEIGQGKRLTHVIFECRGRDQDKDLEYEFRKICDENQQWGYKRNDFSQLRFEPKFAKKSINSSGLQLADLTARPIALKTMRPNQSNRAYDIIASKISSKKVLP